MCEKNIVLTIQSGDEINISLLPIISLVGDQQSVPLSQLMSDANNELRTAENTDIQPKQYMDPMDFLIDTLGINKQLAETSQRLTVDDLNTLTLLLMSMGVIGYNAANTEFVLMPNEKDLATQSQQESRTIPLPLNGIIIAPYK